jgi:hypothetical protein
MKGILTNAVLTGLLLCLTTIPSRGQRENKEKPSPIRKEALLGKWEGKSGTTTLKVVFGEKEARVWQEDPALGIGKDSSTPYKIGDDVVKLDPRSVNGKTREVPLARFAPVAQAKIRP